METFKSRRTRTAPAVRDRIRRSIRLTLGGSLLGLGIVLAALPSSGGDYDRPPQPDRTTRAQGSQPVGFAGYRRMPPAAERNPHERYGTVRRGSWTSVGNARLPSFRRRGFLARGQSDEGDEDSEESRFDPGEENIRLWFTNRTWADVLHHVAEASHSVLVMDKVPPGRFSIYDRKKHTRKEAVRILNEKLESKNFRLIEKGKYLDVLYLKTARAKYHRHELPRYAPPKRDTRWDEPKIPRYKRSVHTIRPVRRTSGRGPLPERSSSATARTAENAGRSNSLTRSDVQRAVHSLPSRINGLAGGDGAASEKPVTRSVRTRNRKAVDVARAIYKPLKGRAKLLDAGPSGLPAFQVFAPKPDEERASFRRQGAGDERVGPTLFAVGIDTAKNELVVEATPEQNAEVVRLIQFLDDAVVGRGEALRIVATQTNPVPIARTLRPQIERLAQAAANQPMGKGPMEKQPMGKQPPGAKVVVPSIRGRVTIREVPGVGLVVTGNEQDVEAVIRIIRELDIQGRITMPNVTLHTLKHVNSQALAELLNAVYTQLSTIRTGTTQQVATVGFIPVLHPNALLIISSRQGLTAVLELIEQLDRPVDPEKEFRVVHLKSAIASQVVANLDALFQQQAAAAATGGAAQQAATRGLAARVRAIADVRSNAIIIEAAPNDMKTVVNLIERLDRAEIPSVSRVKVIPLKNAVATELATLINNAIQSVINPPAQVTGAGGVAGAGAGAGGQNSQTLREVKSAVLEFLVPEGDRKRLLRSGILADIRVTPDPRTNALVVTAPDVSMALLEQLVAQLDRPSSLVASIKVFTLVNADATAMGNLLATLFPTQQAGGAQQQPAGIQVTTAEDASSGLIPLRFAVEPRTNSIIAIGGEGALSVVEAVVLRLDLSGQRQRYTTVIKLRNSPATEVSTAINNFLTSQRNLAQIDPTIITNQQLLEQEIIVVPETVTNSLLISATPRYFDEIRAVVDRLDQPPPQVVIQALIVEVELTNTDEFGVELGFQDPLLFNRGFIGSDDVTTIPSTFQNASGTTTTSQTIISQQTTPGFNFNNQPLGTNIAANPSAVAQQALSNFSLGRVNGDLGFGGLVLSAQSSSVSVLLRALAAKRTVHILSRPQVTALDNQLAQINVGQRVPIVTGVTAATGTSPPIPSFGQPTDVGIILTVTPRIRPDDSIVMETVATKSSLAGQGVPIFTDASTGNTVESPILNIRQVQTTVAVPNGQTIVLGGLITKEDDTIERKVPWLGDLPILKYAFRYDSTTTRRTELLVFLTPRIVRDDADFELVKQIETERMHFIEQDAEAVHGPLFSVPKSTSDQMPRPLSTSPRSGMSSGQPDFDDGNVPTTDLRKTSYQPSVTGVPAERTRRRRLGFFTETHKKQKPDIPNYHRKKRGFFSFPWSRKK